MASVFLVGAGPVGMATSVGFARLGHRVTVADIDTARIAAFAAGRSPFFEPGLEEAVRDGLALGRLSFTTDPVPEARVDLAIVCVGTPSDAGGELSTAAVEVVVTNLLEAGDRIGTIAVRSTLPAEGPARLVELAGRHPRRPRLITNPEFMREGCALEDFERPSRVVVGWVTPDDRAAAEDLLELYAPLGAPGLLADAASVALVKLATNTFLATKIAFANEWARIADAVGADAAVVMAGVGLDPRIGPAFLRPGPGIGGSCLPEQAVAIRAATARLGIPAPLLSSVAISNVTHTAALVERLAAALGGSLAGRRVAVLGLAFKANTDDVRESPALALVRGLRAAGASVTAHDPVAGPAAQAADPELMVGADVASVARGADAILVATEWPAYAEIDWPSIAPTMAGNLVYDTRRVVDADAARAAGLRYVALGVADRP